MRWFLRGCTWSRGGGWCRGTPQRSPNWLSLVRPGGAENREADEVQAASAAVCGLPRCRRLPMVRGLPGPSPVLFPRAEAKGEAGSAGKDAVAMPLSCCVPVCQPGLSVSAGGVGRSGSTAAHGSVCPPPPSVCTPRLLTPLGGLLTMESALCVVRRAGTSGDTQEGADVRSTYCPADRFTVNTNRTHPAPAETPRPREQR